MNTSIIRFLFATIATLIIGICYTQQMELDKMNDLMIETQIISRGINDKNVIDAMRNVKRHMFVPDNYIEKAYYDTPLPIGYEQTISQPFIVAYMTQELQLDSDDKVLEIGTGSGYQAAILAEICKEVITIEIVEPLGLRAKQLLADLNYQNIKVIIGDGYMGYPEEAPYNAVIVTCAPNDIPDSLIEQLVEGGRLVIPYGTANNQKLIVFIKRKGELIERQMLPVRFVPMVNEKGEKY